MTEIKFKRLPFEKRNKHVEVGASGEAKEHVSDYLITMSTNVVMSEEEAEKHSEPLLDMSEHVFGKTMELAKIVEFLSYGDDGKSSSLEPDDSIEYGDAIKSVDVSAKAEVGYLKAGSRLHLHVSLKIWHTGYISLRREEMLQNVNEYLESIGFPHPIKYMNIGVKRPSSLDYLRIQGTERREKHGNAVDILSIEEKDTLASHDKK